MAPQHMRLQLPLLAYRRTTCHETSTIRIIEVIVLLEKYRSSKLRLRIVEKRDSWARDPRIRDELPPLYETNLSDTRRAIIRQLFVSFP